MQNSGESEFSGERKTTTRLALNFWQSFLLALSGAAGLISLVTDGPIWIALTGFSLVIGLLFWLLVSQKRKKNK